MGLWAGIASSLGAAKISLGITAAGLAATTTLYFLWQGALEERDTNKALLEAAQAETIRARSVADAWINQYSELRADYLQVALEGARAAEREGTAAADARQARQELRAVRSKENEVIIPECRTIPIRTVESQRMRNERFARMATSIAGDGAIPATSDSIRLSDSSEPLLPSGREDIDNGGPE